MRYNHSALTATLRFLSSIVFSILFFSAFADSLYAEVSPNQKQARLFASQNAEAMSRSYRTLKATLQEADKRTLLIPNFFMLNPVPGIERYNYTRYSPFHSGADLYGYLVIAAYLLEPQLYQTRMLEMLRNEKLYTSAKRSIPGEYSIRRQEVGRASVFGAAEYAKDGLISITELVNDSPWFWRMHEMMIDVMELATVETKYGKIPAEDSELNGDLLQVLPRLYWKTGDFRFVEWNRRISDAYLLEILPKNGWLPVKDWSFKKQKGKGGAKLRDHGNETIVGLVLSYTMESLLNSDRVPLYREAITKMMDRILQSANPDGLLYNKIDTVTLKPLDEGLADNWGYIYGAVYNMYLLTGDERYRNAIDRVLTALPKYLNYPWEGEHYDGYADSIESALYLVNRLPNQAASDWMDSEIKHIWKQQTKDGHSDRSYLQGNFIRTSLLYGLMKSKGLSSADWREGLGLGAVVEDKSLVIEILPPQGQANWSGTIRFDSPRHREIYNLPKNFIRLNEFPEWYTVLPMKFYQLSGPTGQTPQLLLGAELTRGVKLSSGSWILTPKD